MSRAHMDYLTANMGDLLKMTYTDNKGKQQHVLRGRTGLAILHKYADRANKYSGRAWPSRSTLADELNEDRKNVTLAVAGLVAGGLLRDTGDREGQAIVYDVFPGQVTLERRANGGASGGADTTSHSASGGAGGGAGGGVGGGADTTSHDDDDESANPAAARASGQKSSKKRNRDVEGTRTPTPTGDRLESPVVAAARGGENERWKRVCAAAIELDQVQHGPLKLPAMRAKRVKQIEQAALEALGEYSTAGEPALAALVICRVHDTEPEPDLLRYLEDQQAAALGMVPSDYTDPDTEPDWWALDDEPAALDSEPRSAAPEPDHLTPETWSNSAAYREVREAVKRMKAGVVEVTKRMAAQTPSADTATVSDLAASAVNAIGPPRD